MVKIEINRTGFPVSIGEIELWFDSSAENLKKFVYVEEIANQRIKEIAKKAEHIHFPEEINDETIENIEFETIEDAFNISKEYIALQYDVIFGDGTFKEIYKEYPDVIALEDAFELVSNGIAERLEEENDKRTQKYKDARLELINKRNKKKKK